MKKLITIIILVLIFGSISFGIHIYLSTTEQREMFVNIQNACESLDSSSNTNLLSNTELTERMKLPIINSFFKYFPTWNANRKSKYSAENKVIFTQGYFLYSTQTLKLTQIKIS